MRQDFPRAVRLLRSVDYEAVYGTGQRRSSPQFTVFFRSQRAPAGGPQDEASDNRTAVSISRFGISVKKALGGAVVRNRIRRRIREILRHSKTEIPSGWDMVIHPKRSVAEAPFEPLQLELLRLLQNPPGPRRVPAG